MVMKIRQIPLRLEQHKLLEAEKGKTGASVAFIVRRLIDNHFKKGGKKS